MAEANRNSRTGRYVLQPTGYRAFLPNPLPPHPPIAFDPALLQLLSAADRALGRLDGASETLPNLDMFVYMYVRKEAVLSSQIEGTQASLIDVLEFESKLRNEVSAPDAAEVLNYITAMDYGLARLKELPVSLRLIREIHGKLLHGVRGSEWGPGEFRTSQNWIGPPGSTLANATFVPPPPHELFAALGQLEAFLHDDEPLPVLVKVGLSHAQFETIHPFLDGNGRVGRMLVTFLLCERNILRRPLLYLSHYFKRNRSEYYDRLQGVRDRGEWEEWLKFFLTGVFEVAQEAVETARRILQLREEHRLLIANKFGRGTSKALQVLENLYVQPVVSVESVMRITNMGYSGANGLVSRFQSADILQELTGQRRNRAFGYRAYLELFE